MAACKKKKVKQVKNPDTKVIREGGNPNSYYMQHPTWCFSKADNEKWAFSQNHIGEIIWTEIIPRLVGFESQTWKEILVGDKKSNHSIDVNELNKCASDRLAELHIEAESVISLRLSGKHRIYGYIINGTFYILWYDEDHGDNNTCVCRSHLKHT